MTWDLSCPDWRDRLRTGRSLVPELPLDLVTGSNAVKVFNKLKLADVPGTPTMEEAGGEWFRDIVGALFGSLDVNTRERMIREVFLLVSKKNSKTTNGALLMLTALLLNQRPKAPFLMTAPVQDVADLAFSAVSGAIQLDPVLDKKLHIRDHLKQIIHRETKATLEIMTFDPAVVTGQKVVGALIDELHVVAKMAKAASAIRQLRGGMLPFPEAFLAFITTQSEEVPAGVFRAELLKAREIRDGKRMGSMLPILYEFPPEMQAKEEEWGNPENWHMVTPNAGRSISIPRLMEEAQTAKETSKEEFKAWASQHLNVEIGLALQSNSWAGGSFWLKCGDPKLTLQQILKRSEVVTIGIDGGGLDDLLAICVLGRERVSEGGDGVPATFRWLHYAKAWMHPIALERRKSEELRYRDLEKTGDLVIVGEIGQDLIELADIVEECEDAGVLDQIGADAAGIGGVVDEITDRNIEHSRVVGISQGWKMTGAIKHLEREVAADGKFIHGASPLMAWAVGNARVEPRGNAIVITKQASGSAKIDPLMATLNAVALMAMNPKPRKKQFQMFSLA